MDASFEEQVVALLKVIGKAVWLEKTAIKLGYHDQAAKYRKEMEEDLITLLAIISVAIGEYSRGPKKKVTP